MRNICIRITVQDQEHEIFSEQQVIKTADLSEECFKEAREVLNRIEKYYKMMLEIFEDMSKTKGKIRNKKRSIISHKKQEKNVY